MTEQRRLAAILVADVVGYSKLIGSDEAGTLAQLRSLRTEGIEPQLAKHAGRLFKSVGDGFLVEFASAVQAVACAKAIQEANAAGRLPLRIGIHLGDVVVQGDDLMGDGVNVAARIEGLADPGGIALSRAVHEQVRDKLDLGFIDKGEIELKNIARPVQVFVVGGEKVMAAPTALPLPDKPSIAVLPFSNMSGDAEQEYFADGIVEDIITALSRFKSLFVIARNSSFTYKGKAVDIKQVGRELGVRYLLEGSVRRGANRIRITGQLLDADSGAHLWADRYDGALEDVFELQDQITKNVVGAVAPRIGQAEIERAKRKPASNLHAYDIFLRGMARINDLTRESYGEALRLFYRAIELDEEFAAPYGMVARCYAYIRGQNWSVDRHLEESETLKMTARVAALGNDDALALCSAGYAVMRICNDDDLGAAMVDQALSINENLAIAWTNRGAIGVLLGEHDIAIGQLLRALRLSPLDPQAYFAETMIATSHFLMGRPADALTWTTKALAHRPDYMVALWVAACAHAFCSNRDEARKCIDRIGQLNPGMHMSNLKAFIPMRRTEDIARIMEATQLAGLPE